ncbi:MAG: endonuclease domain-containing protein [Chitinophagaceae bacterium]
MTQKKMHAGALKYLYQRARELRNTETHAEEILWNHLRLHPKGHKFRRQHPYSIFILDFYCHKLLVIEVDGSVHGNPEVKLADKERESLLEKDGLKVIRFSNEIIINQLEAVIEVIDQHLI